MNINIYIHGFFFALSFFLVGGRGGAKRSSGCLLNVWNYENAG